MPSFCAGWKVNGKICDEMKAFVMNDYWNFPNFSSNAGRLFLETGISS
jgi:hypothetical protein